MAASARADYEAPNAAYAPPTAYYNAASGTGFTLRTNLHNIVSANFTSRSYGDSRYAMGTGDTSNGVFTSGNEFLDPNNSSNILLVYNRASVDGQWDNGITWNREHVWPKNLLNLTSSQVSNTYKGVASDAFELRPANPTINSTRGDNGYGFYLSNSNPGTTYGLNSNNGTQYWNPGAADRGEVSRAIFYMATRWLDPLNASRGTSNTNLEIVNGVPSDYNFGDLNSLLHWNYMHGVDNYERRYNQYIYGSSGNLTDHALNHDYYQGNRNPFIDHPEYVWAVFGGGNNNAQIHVGGSAASDGSSATTVNLRVMKNGTWGTTNTSVVKTGANPTTYDLTGTSNVVSAALGVGQPFDYNGVTRSIAVGLNDSTATTGLKTGTLTVNNTDLTTGGAGLGSADANDTITVNGQVVDNRVVNTTTANFGRVVIGANVTTGTTLSSPGDDDHNTRVTVNGNASASDSNGVFIVGATSGMTFNGTFTSGGRTVQANFATTGGKVGSRSFNVSGEGLTGENVQPVSVGYSATAVDHAQPSLAVGTPQASQSVDFGYVPVGFAARTAGFTVYNNPSSSGETLTAGLDVDGSTITGAGVGEMTDNVVASNPASPLAAGTSGGWTYTATFTPAIGGDKTATHTIAVSDENIPGGVARPSLGFTTAGYALASAAFPASGFIDLYTGETYSTGAFEIQAGVALEKRGVGTINITGPQNNGANSSLTINNGAVNFGTDAGSALASPLSVTVGAPGAASFASTQHLNNLQINAGANASVTAGNDKTIVANQFAMGSGARLDISDNRMVVRNTAAGSFSGSSYAGVAGLVASGYNTGNWDGPGIITSQSNATGGNTLTAIGVAAASDVLGLGPTDTAAWEGETVTGSDALVKYTYAGDANLDGAITGDDYFQIDSAASTSLSGWFNGDFNYDGVINGDDYFLIDGNFPAQGPPVAILTPSSLGGVVSVPEPAAIGVMFAVAGTSLLRRRRRERRAA